MDVDPTGTGILREKGLFMGMLHKTQLLSHIHIGDLITSIHKVSMVTSGQEVLLYTCQHGTIGILVPLALKEDINFISTLKQHIRTEQMSLVSRDHLAWRRCPI
jgi:splicing factor 3B subunit 3